MVTEVPEGAGGDLNGDAFAISTDAATLARIAAGATRSARWSAAS